MGTTVSSNPQVKTATKSHLLLPGCPGPYEDPTLNPVSSRAQPRDHLFDFLRVSVVGVSPLHAHTIRNSLPLQHPHHPVKILQRAILDHNLASPLPIPDPHPHPQHLLQRPLRRLHIRIHPPRSASLIRLAPP